jgi:hypothetical protein
LFVTIKGGTLEGVVMPFVKQACISPFNGWCVHSKGIKDGKAYDARFCYDVCEDYYGNNNFTIYKDNIYHCCQSENCNSISSGSVSYSFKIINYIMGTAILAFFKN